MTHDDQTPSQYRTEFSFRRDADNDDSAVEPEAGGVQPPADEGIDEPTAQVDEPAEPVEESVDETTHDVAASAGDSEEKTPFYRREISFRRKKAEPVAAAALAAEAQAVAEAQQQAEPEQVEAVPDAELAEPVPMEPEPVALEPQEEEQQPVAEPEQPKKSRRSVRATRPAGAGRSGRGKTRRVVGLKIGASHLSAAVVVQRSDRHELVQLARAPLAEGVVVDGEVRDAEALTEALKSFFDANGLQSKDVRIGVASNRIGVRTFDIVGVQDESRFDNAVRFKAHEVLPIAGHESMLDYRVLEERQAENGEIMRRVLIVVAPGDQVQPYIDACTSAGIRLAGVDLEALGLLRAFVPPQPIELRRDGDTAQIVVSIGHEASVLLVSGGGVCEFTRVFEWGGKNLRDGIAEELDVPAAEAEQILQHLSLAASDPGRMLQGLDDTDRARALDAVRLQLTPFARELVGSLQFYQSQPDSLGIGEIVVTGGVSHLPGLAESLHQMIGVAVRVGDPLGRVAHEVDFEAEEAIGALSVALGLAIEDEVQRSVNLLPRELREVRRRPNMVRTLAPLAAIIPIAALGFVYLQASGDVSTKESELSALEAEFAALPKPKRPVIDAGVQGQEAVRATALAAVLGQRVAWDGVLRGVSQVLPANVWLTDLAAKTLYPQGDALAVAATTGAPATPGAPVDEGPKGVTIVGYTYSQADVARLLARLTTLPTLTNVSLESSALTAIGDRQVVQFTILADIREAGGAS